MYRKNITKLNSWIKKSSRKPLLIRGARQVGKSTLVRQFANEAKRDLCEINLEKHPQLDEVFRSLDPQRIINAIQSIQNTPRLCANSLLFLDEIQATPHALAALRYLYEEMPSLPVIAAGSLLEFILLDHSFSMPVGRIEYLHMHPMNFEEFLMAIKSENVIPAIRSAVKNTNMDSFIHNQICDHLKHYLFVGGMPEAVKVFSETRNLREVSEVHQSILNTYKDDFAKYSKREDLLLLHKTLAFGARAAGERIKYVKISRDEQSRDIKHAIDLLCYAKVMDRIYHTDAQRVPLGVDINEKVFKLLFLDVGLMNASNSLDWQSLSQEGNLSDINSGKISEQFVGQELRVSLSLFFWLREAKAGNAEVDYVISQGQKVIPIEVKSGKSGRLKSLFAFANQKRSPLLLRFDMNLPSTQKVALTQITEGSKKKGETSDLVSLPLYAAGFVFPEVE